MKFILQNILIILFVTNLNAQSAEKVALVIGNGAYLSGTSLANPVNDAKLMESTLKSLGFTVITRTNATKAEMENGVRSFAEKLSGSKVALFYYAGHGIQSGTLNYLIPIDAKLNKESDLKYEAVAVNFIVDEFESYPNNTNIVILDACRDNPLRSWQASRGSVQGFKAINPTSGTIIAFATSEGSTAADGTGSNGLYTSYLVKEMKKAIPIEKVFKNTRVAVESASGNKQSPQEWSKLKGDFYFVNPKIEIETPNKLEEEKKGDTINVKVTTTTKPDLNIEMIDVKGGTFTMGCTPEQEKDCDNFEKPAHQKTLRDYKIGKFEVTQAQWNIIMSNNPSHFKDCENCPIENVSWNDIQEFILRLNAKTGLNYRLPSEAEWEYAARGGNKSKSFKYSGSNTLDDVAWFDGNSNGKTHEVGKKEANELGIHDMSGNVWEWCSDWYVEYTPLSIKNQNILSNGGEYVIRGGSWTDKPFMSRLSNRGGNPGNPFRGFGFRLVLDSN